MVTDLWQADLRGYVGHEDQGADLGGLVSAGFQTTLFVALEREVYRV